MAYSTANPPFCIAQGANGLKVWMYSDEDAASVVRVSGYFTNGYTLGMRAGDLLIQVDNDASPIATQLMIVNQASIAGATETVDVSDGVAVTATDSD